MSTNDTHLALVPLDGPPRPQCDGDGRSVMRIDEVTCPACLQLVADRTGCAIAQAEAEIHDAHAIPAGDEPLAALTPAAPTLADLALSWAKYADAIGQDDPFEASILRQCAEALERALTSARIVPADAIVLPDYDPVLIDNDGDRWLVMARAEEGDLFMPISRIRRDYGPIVLAAETPGTGA